MLVPEGKLILDIFERMRDFPLFEFPITPILITLSLLKFSYFSFTL